MGLYSLDLDESIGNELVSFAVLHAVMRSGDVHYEISPDAPMQNADTEQLLEMDVRHIMYPTLVIDTFLYEGRSFKKKSKPMFHYALMMMKNNVE